MNSDPKSPPRGYRITQAMMWPIMKMSGMSCRHFAELCTAKMDRELSVGEKMRFRMHHLVCGLCRNLPEQFETLQKLTCKSCHSDPEPIPGEPLNQESRDRILQAITTEAMNGDENE